MKAFWDDRYRQEEFAYGEAPNRFFKDQIDKRKPGTILLPAEGEGRNAVYAAQMGWEVSAFDISSEGEKKAQALAKKHGVSIDYRVGQLADLDYADEQFDVIALVYAHFPPEVRKGFHQLLQQKLKPGGVVILEAFSKNNLAYRHKNPNVGGPPNAEALYTIDDLSGDFANYEFLELAEKEVELNEGLYHNGTAAVVRLVGVKQD